MTDKLGRLNGATTATQGTTTAYQCPAGKGAKVQIMFRGVAGVNSTLAVTIAGMIVFTTAALTSGNVSYSNSTQQHLSALASTITGATDATTVSPGPKVYWLLPGDVVSYTIGTADFSSMNFQVVGVEVDIV